MIALSCLLVDVAMKSLFDAGRLLGWIKETVSDMSVEKKLRASAAVLLANMARNGDHCNHCILDFVFRGWLNFIVPCRSLQGA